MPCSGQFLSPCSTDTASNSPLVVVHTTISGDNAALIENLNARCGSPAISMTLLAKVLQLSVQDHRQYGHVRAGLLDGNELNLRRVARVALRFPRQAAQRKRRNRPEQAKRLLHGNPEL